MASTISPTTTITIFGSGFSIGGNMVQFQRAGYGDVWLYNGDGHYFWDYNGTQINASLDSRAASGTWNVTVRTSSGGVSSPYTLTIQGSVNGQQRLLLLQQLVPLIRLSELALQRCVPSHLLLHV